MPEATSAPARLYVERCGQCHAAYVPGLMTADMWRLQLDMMRDKMLQAGVAPLTGAESDAITNYLTSNAARN